MINYLKLTFIEGTLQLKRVKKADEIKEPLELHNSFLQKILPGAIFLLAPAANMLRTSRFFIGCM